MRRLFITIIPIVTLLLFIFIMHSGSILKKPLGEEDDIPLSINNIIEAVNNESWDEVDSKFQSLENAWDKVLFRVQFGSERDRIDKLTTSIARLKGALIAEDKASAMMELYEIYNHWEGLGS